MFLIILNLDFFFQIIKRIYKALYQMKSEFSPKDDGGDEVQKALGQEDGREG